MASLRKICKKNLMWIEDTADLHSAITFQEQVIDFEMMPGADIECRRKGAGISWAKKAQIFRSVFSHIKLQHPGL